MINPPSIILNGSRISAKEIIQLADDQVINHSIPEWERQIFSFLKEWYSPDDCIEVKTSGSTGEPQTIRLLKSAMQQSARRTIDFFGLKVGNRLLLSLPCRFIAGKMMVVRAIIGQMDLVPVDPASDFYFLSDSTFDLGAMVPTQVSRLLNSPSGKARLENIRNLLIGGSAIHATLEAKVIRLNNRVVSTYGMTETASHIAIRTISGEKHSDVYQCLPGISVTSGEDKCLVIHASEWPQPLHTKDISEVLSPTSFRILGRADDVIISGGIKYWPETIEKKLESEITRRFVISSLTDEILGEKLVLVIEGEPFEIVYIQQRMEELLTSFERPKAVYFLKKFPETPNGKLKRLGIKEAIHRF